MTLICFLVDNTAASAQRNQQGSMSYLDLFKNSVESICKARNKANKSAAAASQNNSTPAATNSENANGSKAGNVTANNSNNSISAGQQQNLVGQAEQFCLLTTDAPPNNVKATPKDNTQALLSALRLIQPSNRNSLSRALANAFNFIMLWRANTELSQFGAGRVPGLFNGPCHVILITHRRLYSTYNYTSAAQNGVTCLDRNDVKTYPNISSTLPIEDYDAMSSSFSKVLRQPMLYDKVFRWDHQLHMIDFVDYDDYSLVSSESSLALASFLNSFDILPILNYLSIQSMVSESFRLGEILNLNSNCVKLHFKRILTHYDDSITDPPDLKKFDSKWQDCFVNMICNPKGTTNYWPFPESWKANQHSSAPVPIRQSIPTISFVCKRVDAIHHENFPFDKYELVPCSLTSHILANVPPNKCWQLFIQPGSSAILNSEQNRDQYASQYQKYSFGYLRSSINLQSVKLFIMPFNYPALIPLVDELIRILKMVPTPSWLKRFEAYLATVPPLYFTGLKRAFSKIGQPDILTDCPEVVPTEVMMMLKRARANAKTAVECIINENMIQKTNTECNQNSENLNHILMRKRTFLSANYLPNTMDFLKSCEPELNCTLGTMINIQETKEKISKIEYQDDTELLLDLPPSDVPLSSLDKLVDLHLEFMNGRIVRHLDKIMAHRMLVSQSGNYIDYINRSVPELRDIMPLPSRINMFGNPFKVNKVSDDSSPQVDDLSVDDAYDEIELEADQMLHSNQSSPNIKKSSQTKGPISKNFTYRTQANNVNANNENRAEQVNHKSPDIGVTYNYSVSNNLETIYSESEFSETEPIKDEQLKKSIVKEEIQEPKPEPESKLIIDNEIIGIELLPILEKSPKQIFKQEEKVNVIEDRVKINGKPKVEIISSQTTNSTITVSSASEMLNDDEFSDLLSDVTFVLKEPRRSSLIDSEFTEHVNESIIKKLSPRMIILLYYECLRFKRQYFIGRIKQLVPRFEDLLEKHELEIKQSRHDSKCRNESSSDSSILSIIDNEKG